MYGVSTVSLQIKLRVMLWIIEPGYGEGREGGRIGFLACIHTVTMCLAGYSWSQMSKLGCRSIYLCLEHFLCSHSLTLRLQMLDGTIMVIVISSSGSGSWSWSQEMSRSISLHIHSLLFFFQLLFLSSSAFFILLSNDSSQSGLGSQFYRSFMDAMKCTERSTKPRGYI